MSSVLLLYQKEFVVKVAKNEYERFGFLVSSSVFVSLMVPVRVLAVLLNATFKSSAFLGDQTLPLFISIPEQNYSIYEYLYDQ